MSRQTILNVDDNAPNRYIKSRTLRAAGFEVIEAGTGQGAIDVVYERRPDLVLLDIKLPDISGLDVCRRLKEDARTRHIPIVHISATFVTPADEAVSLEAGADIYLAEPVGTQELASAVRTLLRLRTTEQVLAASEERMRLATAAAGIATWDIDAESGATVWSPQFHRMLGLEPGETAPSREAWLARVRPDQREAVAEALERALRGDEPFSLEHRIVRADDGAERCIAPQGKLHVDELRGAPRLIGVAMDVTEAREAQNERERLLGEAQAARQEAEDAARMKDEFLAMLSHELRTPISAMLGWLHLIRSGRLAPEQHLAGLDTIERNARLQARLINDLLDVSRIVTGKMELESRVLRLDRTVENAIETVRIAAAARSIRLVADFAPGRWLVQGSPERLQQVFSNLLSNAVKFSASGSTVRVRLAPAAPGRAQVAIADEGEGIAPELVPHIFDRFRQADSSTSRRHGGLGLGLAIVRSLTELHGGSVRAESEGPGKGATFTVELPLAPEGATETTPEVPSSRSASGAELGGTRMLVVDDDEGAAKMTGQILSGEGAEVRIALGGAHAIEVARAWRPDLLVLDIGMPDEDGYDLLPRLRREIGSGPDVPPAIALTGFAAPVDVSRAARAGFQAHVAKPFEVDALLRVVLRLIAR
jgi:PAS domain S-box-containing protein